VRKRVSVRHSIARSTVYRCQAGGRKKAGLGRLGSLSPPQRVARALGRLPVGRSSRPQSRRRFEPTPLENMTSRLRWGDRRSRGGLPSWSRFRQGEAVMALGYHARADAKQAAPARRLMLDSLDMSVSVNANSFVHRALPLLKWISAYRRDWLLPDVFAG